MRAVFDSKLLISAFFIPGSFSDRILRSVINGKVELVISEPLLRELNRFLQYAFKEDKNSRSIAIDFIKEIATIVQPTKPVRILTSNIMDNLIFEVAEEAKPNFIVSADKNHILKIEKFNMIPVLSASEFSKYL